MIIDPTDRAGEVGTWRFDPDDERHVGWRDEYTVFDQQHRDCLVRFIKQTAYKRGLSALEQSPETVAQVALTKAALRWPEIAVMENPRGWVFKVAANLVRTACANRWEAHERTAVIPGWTSGAGQGPATRAERLGLANAEAVEAVEDDALDRLYPGPAIAALDDLPMQQRIATYLTDVEGFRAKEVSEVLGCPPEKVTSLVRGGRTTLRRRLRKLGDPAWIGGGTLGGVLAFLLVIFGRELLDVLRYLAGAFSSVDTGWLSQLLSLLATVGAVLVKAVGGYRTGQRVRSSGEQLMQRMRRKRRGQRQEDSPAHRKAKRRWRG